MRSQFTVATLMFGVCIGIGLFAEPALQSAVGWLAHRSEPAPQRLGVESRSHGVRIRNLTDDPWSACVVTLDGGYVSPPVALKPNSRATIPYVLFARNEEALVDADGLGRAFRSTEVECADARRRQSFAVAR